jgi:hypothetical protein
MRKSFVLIAALFATTLQLGCGDDVAPHGVPPGRGLDTLDQDQIDAVCDDFSTRPLEAALPTVREYCTVDALARTAIGAGSEAVCDQYLADCLADPPSNLPTSIDPIDPALCPTVADLAGCDLTVGDLDACTAARVQAVDAAWSQVGCSNLSSADAVDQVDFDTLPECQYLHDTCPSVF